MAGIGTTPTAKHDGLEFDDSDVAPWPTGLYDYGSVAKPIGGYDAVTERHIAQFRERGYLVIDNAVEPSSLADATQALAELIDGDELDSRCIQFEKWAAGRLGDLSPEQKRDAVRKFIDFTDKDPRLHAVAYDRRLLALVRRLAEAPEVEILQEMALIKAPGGREKPWHQDRAYFNVPTDVPVVGTWIALHESTPQNGCMRILPGRHCDGPQIHFLKRDWQICDTEIDSGDCVAVPMRPGALLAFDALLPHGTPHNSTSQRRWALQFHYFPKGAANTDDNARMAIFGSEGKNVQC